MIARRHIHFCLLLLLLFHKAATLFSQAQPILSEGFPILLESGLYLSPRGGPLLADLNDDGDLEIIVVSGCQIYVFKSDGSFLSGWPQATANEMREPAAIGDLDHDGHLNIVNIDVALDPVRKSFLYAWDGKGSLLPGFPVALPAGFDPVSLYDLDEDHDLEIVGSFGTEIFVFNHDGTIAPGWPQDISPFYPIAKRSIGDIDFDGEPEIVVTGQFAADRFEDYLGRIYIWNIVGELKEGWPVTLPDNYTFAAGSGAVPVDSDDDGFMEIAAGTFKFIPPNVTGFVVIYRHDGTTMSGWPQFMAGPHSLSGFTSGPAIADIDLDGSPDLIFAASFDHIIAWKGDGSLVAGWPVILSEVDPTGGQSTFTEPAVGDIDGDGDLEIIISNNKSDVVADLWLGRIYVFNHDGTHLPWSPLRPRQNVISNTVTMGDLDRDGSLDLVAVSSGRPVNADPKETWLTVWEIPGVPYVEERFPWPMFGHDRWHTSQYGFKPPDEPVVSVSGRKNHDSPKPKDFVLRQNYPNPFSLTHHSTYPRSAVTVINYELPERAEVRLQLFDLLGSEVRTLVATTKPAGFHQVKWEGHDERGKPVPRGVYFYRMEATSQSQRAEKVSLLRKLVIF